MRIWDMGDDFDHLLYMDADTLAVGHVEAVLDFFAPNGTAAHALGAVHIMHRDSFNAGVMAVQPDKDVFKQLVAASRDPDLEYDYRWGDQGFLNNWFAQNGGFTVLPVEVNLRGLEQKPTILGSILS
jgi:alpha-N-acetylglucosamine transferase